MLLTPKERAERARQLFGMALGLAMLENGWTLDAQPGWSFLAKGAERVNLSTQIDELAEGKISPEEWARMCEKLGITDLPLTLAAESTSAPTGD